MDEVLRELAEIRIGTEAALFRFSEKVGQFFDWGMCVSSGAALPGL